MGHPLHRDDEEPDRGRALCDAFVELADTRGPEYDVATHSRRLIERCRRVLDTAAASVLLNDGPRGRLQVRATDPVPDRRSELWELQAGEGPGVECYESGKEVAAPALAAAPHRWPNFVPRALAAGFASVHALPLRAHSETIGALSLFGRQPGKPNPDVLAIVQAFAEVAALGIAGARDLRSSQTLAEQLQTALNSRVLIEQAKGVLAERGGVGVDEAFERMRRFARRNGRKLNDVAREVVEHTLDTAPILDDEDAAKS